MGLIFHLLIDVHDINISVLNSRYVVNSIVYNDHVTVHKY